MSTEIEIIGIDPFSGLPDRAFQVVEPEVLTNCFPRLAHVFGELGTAEMANWLRGMDPEILVPHGDRKCQYRIKDAGQFFDQIIQAIDQGHVPSMGIEHWQIAEEFVTHYPEYVWWVLIDF